MGFETFLVLDPNEAELPADNSLPKLLPSKIRQVTGGFKPKSNPQPTKSSYIPLKVAKLIATGVVNNPDLSSATEKSLSVKPNNSFIVWAKDDFAGKLEELPLSKNAMGGSLRNDSTEDPFADVAGSFFGPGKVAHSMSEYLDSISRHGYSDVAKSDALEISQVPRSRPLLQRTAVKVEKKYVSLPF